MTEGKTPPPRGPVRSLADEEAHIAVVRRADMAARRTTVDAETPSGKRTIALGRWTNERTTVMVALLAAFLVFVIGRDPKNIELPNAQTLTAWAALAIILAIAVDIGPTSEIAAAMAVLIFVTVMLRYGVDVFEWLNGKVNSSGVQTRMRESGR